MAVSLSEATTEDAELLKMMSIQAFTKDYEQYGSYPPGIESLEWHKSAIEKRNYYKIIYKDEIAGGIYVIPSINSEIEIKYLFISEDFQNKGIGSKIIDLIEETYGEFKVWNLVTPSYSYRNHHFYEKLGYRKTGEFQPDPQNPFQLFEYRKTIKS